MSQIVLSPNAAGSAQFTLAAPDTNTNRTLTLPDAAGTVLVDNAVPSLNGGQLAGMRNKIINGKMEIAQRGTSAAMSTSGAYLLDRWFGVVAAGSAAATMSQVNSGLAGLPRALRIQRNVGTTNTNVHIVEQALETLNSTEFQGQTVTLSFRARRGANFSATGNLLTCNIVTGTGTDQAASGIYSGAWTGWNTINQSQALTTSWQTFSLSVSVAAGATQIGVGFWYAPTGTAGADDWFEITGVQLEVGSVATPFEHRPYGAELALCQRYFNLSELALGSAITTTSADFVFVYKQEMRATPTAAQLANGVNLRVLGSTSNIGITSSFISVGTRSSNVQVTRTTGTWTAGNAVVMAEQGVFSFSAEL